MQSVSMVSMRKEFALPIPLHHHCVSWTNTASVSNELNAPHLFERTTQHVNSFTCRITASGHVGDTFIFIQTTYLLNTVDKKICECIIL
jgi:hypothetical protein